MAAEELLKTYVVLYNYGVESGDFAPLMELFNDDSILEFEDPKIGKFEGKELISGMFQRQTPTAKLELSNIESGDSAVSADFSIEENTEARVGGFKLDIIGNKIKRLIVTI